MTRRSVSSTKGSKPRGSLLHQNGPSGSWLVNRDGGLAGCRNGPLMSENGEGLTKTYNRFHEPEERDPEIMNLRDLHAAMDRAVLDAYGWSDIKTTAVQPLCRWIRATC